MSKVKVKLLVSRTGYGHAGDVVDYPADEAERHEQMGLVAPCSRAPVAANEDEETGDDGPTVAGETDHDAAPSEAAPPSRKKTRK